ncbi:MAG: cobalt-zinc-cadmium efflux system protein [Miltoncostaeaceae bacterium]|nr:cobalt-zinc-cadmium efflux system protein [Miltoncostaeaceae bacterium]
MAHVHHHGHRHPHGGFGQGAADARRLTVALALILALLAGEVVAGVLASSLALLSDAAHMLTDAAAIGLSLVAARLAVRPAAGSLTYGWKRVEILSAQANGVTLLVLAGFIVAESVRRLVDPPDVTAPLVLAVALVGALVNVAAVWVLSGADRRSLNVEGSFQHLLTDLYAFIGTAAAAVVILLSGWDRADPVASLLVAALMLRSAYGLLKASGRVFLEAAPEGVDPDEIGHAIAGRPDVVQVHDLHVWEVTSGFPALSAHVLVSVEADCHAARRDLEEMLASRFGIRHSTLQVEHTSGRLLSIARPPEGPPPAGPP